MAMASEDVGRILKAVDERRRHAFRVSVATSLTIILVAFLGLVIWVTESPGLVSVTIASLVMLTATASGPWIGLWVGFGRVAVPGLVVWLRRFRPDYGTRLRFHQELGSACCGLANPLTIQDASFNASLVAGSNRMGIAGALIFLPLAVGIAVVLVGGNVDPSVNVKQLLVVPVVALWVRFCLLPLVHRRGVVSRDWSAGQVAQYLDALRYGRPMSASVEVLKVARTGDEWRLIIQETLARADLAVIDVSEITEAIIWETDQALQQLHPDRILLVAEEGSVRAEALHEQFAGKGFTAPTGNWVERALLFYPARPKGMTMKEARDFVKQCRDFRHRLRREIAWRLYGPSVHEATTLPEPEVPSSGANRPDSGSNQTRPASGRSGTLADS